MTAFAPAAPACVLPLADPMERVEPTSEGEGK